MESNEKLELRERLDLIEKMMTEGRKTTAHWGWVFVLWGVVLFASIGWSSRIQNGWPWIVVVAIGAILTSTVASRKNRHQPKTALGWAIGSTWIGFFISICLIFSALSASGRLADPHITVAVACAMLGMANGISALILRWKVQFACAAVWWAAAVVGCFGTNTEAWMVFLATIFLCQIVFGIGCMIVESQSNKRRSPSHA